MNNNFFKHFMVIGTSTIINMIVGLITTPIITRLVGTSAYGQFSIFTMYVSIGVMVLCMGLDQGIIRFYKTENSLEYRRMLIRACCILPIIVASIFTAVLVILSAKNIIVFEFDTQIVFLLGITILIQIINRLNMVQLRSAYKTKQFAFINSSYKIIYIVFVIIFVVGIKMEHLKSLVIATIISYLVVVIVGIYFQKSEWKIWSIHYDKKFNYKELYKYSLPYVISMGVTTLFQAIDKISLNRYCSYSEVGVYASAMNIIQIFAIVQSTFNTLWAPLAVEHFQNNPEDKEYYRRGNRIITVIMFSIGIGLILFKDVFVLLLGSDYRQASYIIPFLIFNPIMYTISETTVGGIVFYKKSTMQIVVAVIACVTNIIGNTILVPIYGCQGAAISTGLSYIVFFVARTLIANRYYKIDWKLKRFFVLTISTAFYALYNSFFDSFIVSFIGFVVVACIMFVLHKETVFEIYKIGMAQVKGILNKYLPLVSGTLKKK